MNMIKKLLLLAFLSATLFSQAQITPQEAIVEMARGINLGNTLEPPTEGGWNNGPAQEKYFEAYKNAGFTCVRIPIRWDNHTGKTTPFAINEDWLNRIEEIMDWGLSRDMFIIINAHHEDWFKIDYANQKVRMDSIWSQVSRRFQDKSEKLFFEMINEPRTGDNEGLTQAQIDEFNERTLGIIRKTNPTRIVIFSGKGWSNSPDLLAAKVPNDDYLIGYFHSYDPWSFAGEAKGTWGTSKDYQDLINKFKEVQTWSTAKNVPVMIGEFGAQKNCEYNSRMKHYAAYTEQALAHGFAYQAWEDGGDFQILNRTDTTWNDIKDILINSSDTTVNDLKLSILDDTLINVAWSSRSLNKSGSVIERRTLETSFSPIVLLGSLSPTTFIDSTAEVGKPYFYRVVELFDTKKIPSFPQTIQLVPTVREPFYGTPFEIPGIIQAEDYDKGGELLTYHDTDPQNVTAAYRLNEGVDIEARSDGFQVGYVALDEWIEYTINVPQAGNYNITSYTASQAGGGTLTYSFNGTNKTTVNIPSTGDWVTLKPTMAKVSLSQGEQVMRITISKLPAYNIDKFEFTVNTGIVNELEKQLKIFPNPASDNLEIDLAGTNMNQILIYDANGRIVYQNSINNDKTILDISNLNSGIYVVKAITLNGTFQTKFIVK